MVLSTVIETFFIVNEHHIFILFFLFNFNIKLVLSFGIFIFAIIKRGKITKFFLENVFKIFF